MAQDPAAKIQELENKVAVLTRLAEVSTVLNSTLQLDRLLGYLMDAAADIVGAEAASVLLWNHKTQQLFFAATTTGSTSQALLGKPVPLEGSVAGLIMRERKIVAINDALNDPRVYQKSGQEIHFVTRSLMGVPMTSKDKMIGVLEVINKRRTPWTEEDRHHMTVLASQAAVAIEAAQMVMALQKVNGELNELDKLKNDFIAIASHELRTPLGVIMGYASFLQETEDEEINDHASKVLQSALQLRGIIEGMTNLRYLKQKTSELSREPVALSKIINDVGREANAQASAKEHQFDIVLPPDDVMVYVDAGRMRMALNNLLNNAVRFTPDRGTIRIEGRANGQEEAQVIISDNGIGLTEEQMKRVFDEFYQVEDHMIRKHGGLGIGLSIAKAVIDAHGGRIWANSPGLNQGSTFYMTVPLAKPEMMAKVK
jgi:signal transduction histidine kinase